MLKLMLLVMVVVVVKLLIVNDVNIGYFLQVGVYKMEGDVEQQCVCFGFQGFELKVLKCDVSGVIYFCVCVGLFLKFEDMNLVCQCLFDVGVDMVVICFMKQ